MNETLRNLSCLRLLFIIMLVCAILASDAQRIQTKNPGVQSEAGGDEVSETQSL